MKRASLGSTIKKVTSERFAALNETLTEGLDFLKVKDYAVINMSNIFPVPPSECAYVDFSKVKQAGKGRSYTTCQTL